MKESGKHIIEKVNELLLSGKYNELIPFVGAGSSIPLKLPSWANLVEKYHHYLACEIDFDRLRHEQAEDWPKISDIIFESTGSNLEKYNQFMRQLFQPEDCEYTSVHNKIIDNYQKIITTNYDIAFENALNYKREDLGYPEEVRKKYNYETLVYPDSLNPISFQGRCIAYLHGRINSDMYVFRGKEYQIAYEDNSSILTFLRTVVTKYPIVFIGFSFDDIIFRRRFKEVIVDEKRRLENQKKIHGNFSDREAIAGIYVIINESQLQETIHKSKLNEIVGENIDLNDIRKYITIEDLGDDKLKLKPTIDINSLSQQISLILKEKTRNFIDEVIRLNRASERKEYFQEIGADIIEYSGRHVEVGNILEELIPKPGAYSDSETLPSSI